MIPISRRAALFAALAAPLAAWAQDAAPDPEKEKENAGRITAQGFLLVLDRRDWGTAWESTSALFRRNVPLGKWMDAIPQVRQPLGNLVERSVVGTGYKDSLPGHPGKGDYVTATFRSKFENKEVEETLTVMREPDARWRVTGYQVR
ncbi:DUF4019 domain-containing protein [Ramlibacter sp.]|uniref:DUF4019 domain-containing protein n=1 Tax=Ramlibacter sp. TaxID=1917967 RepID=UPI003D13F3A7